MSEYVPYERFKCLKNVDKFDVMSISGKSQIEYLQKLTLNILINCMNCTMITHQLQKNLTVSNDMLSTCCKKIADEIKVGDVKKLIADLGNKTKYVVHNRNLQLYLSLGLKLTKIHRVSKFNQSDWMKKYIGFNTKKRMNAANDSEKKNF